MTDEEWQAIQKYVLGRLDQGSPFKITAKELAAELGIKPPIYKEIGRLIKETNPMFSVRTTYWNELGEIDPIDPLTFSE